MADVARDYRSGGGYDRRDRGGYNKRKRYREDDDNDHSQYRNQRPRHDRPAPPGTRIRRGLLDIGEDTLRMPHEVAIEIAKLTAEHYDDSYVQEVFSAVVSKLVVEQPLKLPFLAGVVLYAHAEKPQIAKDVVAQIGPQLQEALDKGNWREFKNLLRFLACIGRVFPQDGVIPILDELFNRAVDLQTASTEDSVGIELVKIILLTIPYLLAFTDDATLQQKVAALLEKTDIVASAPHVLEGLVEPFPSAGDDVERPMAYPSVISLLQRQSQEEAANGWPLKCIPRVYDPSLQRTSHNGDVNGEANGHGDDAHSSKCAFPAITVPSPINPGTKTLFPELYWSLFADQEVESVPPTTSIASTLIRDVVVDTANVLNFNREATSKFLSALDCFWDHNTFVARATPFDKLRTMESGRPIWKPEDVAIDAIFSQIFTLPAPEHRLVYYHSLITEICKIAPQAIAPSLGRAIRFLYRGLEVMDLELAYRYMDWFAHHLSNFEFRWKWAEWTDDLNLPDLHPRKAFINGVLDKEMRLSFVKRIRETLPEPYHSLIPASLEKDFPDFKYADEQTPFAKEGREILALLKKKASEDEVQRVLDSVHEQATALAIADPLATSTDIYMTAILSIGSKSLSHVLSTIDRCKERLLAIGAQSEQARRQIITSVMNFWHEHPGTAVNIVDKLLNYTIVTPMSVIQWALVDNIDRGRALAVPHIYEMVSITMFKVTNRVLQLLHHRNNVAVPFPQRQQIDEALPRERQGMRDLFAAIEDAVAGVATGAQDDMIERHDGAAPEQDSIKAWGVRWARVWTRKAAVEEAIVGEAVVAPLVEPEPEPDVEAPAVPDVEADMDQVS